MRKDAQKVRRITIFTAAVIGLAGIGFLFKIWEFGSSLNDSAAMGFAIVPLSSYLLTGTGFLFLLIWSATRGAFKDVEAPKYRMMFLEESYARDEGDPDPIWDHEEWDEVNEEASE